MPLELGDGEYRPHRRLHLQALLRYLFLQILGIIYAHDLIVPGFVNAKDQHAATVLIGEAGQGIVQLLRAVRMGRFQFYCLFFCLLFANFIC